MSPPVTNYETSTRAFAALLQHWRAELKLTRAKAAAALGVPPTTLDGWIAGRACGKETMVRRLMEKLAIEARV